MGEARRRGCGGVVGYGGVMRCGLVGLLEGCGGCSLGGGCVLGFGGDGVGSGGRNIYPSPHAHPKLYHQSIAQDGRKESTLKMSSGDITAVGRGHVPRKVPRCIIMLTGYNPKSWTLKDSKIY